MEDKFFSKMAKSVSEFMILAILKEKSESHPYEIQQALLSKFSSQQDHSSKMLDIMSTISEKITQENKDLHSESQKVKEQPGNKKEHLLLSSLNSEIEIIKEYMSFPIKIWETIGAIYQVMSELEAQECIEVIKREIVKGRTRKIYKITQKGELVALRMMFAFNGINSTIYPQFLHFGDILNQFYTTHIKNLNNLFNSFNNNNYSMLFDLSKDTHTGTRQIKFDPFLQMQTIIILHLLTLIDNNSEITSKIFPISNTEQNLELIENLKLYLEKISKLVA